MSRQTTNYGFNISEGTDLVNPLTDIFPNFESLDTDLKDVSDSAVGTATELLTGTVHALVRSDSDRNVFTFTATSNFEAGETFTLDGVQVTALTPDGQTLSTGCYIIGSEVLVAVKGTLMTVYVNPSKALDSDKLDGHDSTYFATASDVSDLSGDVSALSSKVGTGTLTVGNDCVDGINTLNTQFPNIFNHAAQNYPLVFLTDCNMIAHGYNNISIYGIDGNTINAPSYISFALLIDYSYSSAFSVQYALTNVGVKYRVYASGTWGAWS